MSNMHWARFTLAGVRWLSGRIMVLQVRVRCHAAQATPPHRCQTAGCWCSGALTKRAPTVTMHFWWTQHASAGWRSRVASPAARRPSPAPTTGASARFHRACNPPLGSKSAHIISWQTTSKLPCMRLGCHLWSSSVLNLSCCILSLQCNTGWQPNHHRGRTGQLHLVLQRGAV
jgi:hypothetical protein